MENQTKRLTYCEKKSAKVLKNFINMKYFSSRENKTEKEREREKK